jgi:hypothetical protein
MSNLRGEDQNAVDSIPVTWQFDSNEIDRGDSRDENHEEPRNSLCDGM